MSDGTDLTTHPHDAFFKAQFAKIEIARAFFESKLPQALTTHIDWSKLQLDPTSFVKKSLRQLHTDLIFKVGFLNQELRLGLIFEHQSKVDSLIPLRFGDYQLEYAHRELKEKRHPFDPIICVVIHQGPDPWKASTQFSDLYHLPPELRECLNPFIPQFEHLLIDLTQIDPTKENEPKLRIILTLMKMARLKDRLLDFFAWLDSESTLTIDQPLFEECILYSLHAGQNIDTESICATFKKKQQLTHYTMTAAQKLIDEGLEKGLHRGLDEGLDKGEWLGQVRVLRSIMGLPAIDKEVLRSKSVEELKLMFQQLEAQYNNTHKG